MTTSQSSQDRSTSAAPQSDLIASLRREARLSPESGIVEVMNYGRDRPGIIPLWAGEGDLPTPQFICDEVAKSLRAGETFYTWQRGIPELRDALVDYHRKIFDQHFERDRFTVTGSGMQAIQIAVASIAGPGDEVLVPTPCWPNITAALSISGAHPICVPMTFEKAGWQVDLDTLFAAATDQTRALFINSPSNPTGWTASLDELAAIVQFARERDLWIIADEVYNRFVYDTERAPSFYDCAQDTDKILYVNTFSKNWAMTGWRVGWISAPAVLGQILENLVQYSTSGVAAFMQRGAVAALRDGEPFLASQIARAAKSRQDLCRILEAADRVRFAWPAGAFYLFFAIQGEEDTRKLGLRLVDEAGIGVAPGTAFGPGGDAFMRLCYGRDPASVAEAGRRLVTWLEPT